MVKSAVYCSVEAVLLYAVEHCRATGQWGQGVVAVEGQKAVPPGTKLGVTVELWVAIAVY